MLDDDLEGGYRLIPSDFGRVPGKRGCKARIEPRSPGCCSMSILSADEVSSDLTSWHARDKICRQEHRGTNGFKHLLDPRLLKCLNLRLMASECAALLVSRRTELLTNDWRNQGCKRTSQEGCACRKSTMTSTPSQAWADPFLTCAS